MANGKDENVQSVLPCGKKTTIKSLIPGKTKARPATPPKPPDTYEIKIQVFENNKEKKKVGSISLRDSSLNNQLADLQVPQNGLALYSNLKTTTPKSFSISNYDKEKYRVKAHYGPFTPEKTGKGKTNEILIDPIIRIYLKLMFKDPNKENRSFPAGVKLKMEFEAPWDGNSHHSMQVETDKDGILTDGVNPYVEVLRTAKNFKLDFTQGPAKFIVCEKNVRDKQDAKPAKTCELIERDKLDKDLLAFRGFKLPSKKWTIENSDWDCAKSAAYNQKKKYFDIYSNDVGQKGKADEIVLDMHWQFTRFVYYDRCIKGPDMLSILPVMLQGYNDKENLKTKPEPDSDTASNWVCGEDIDKNVQCIPWIIQEAGKEKPDKKVLLKFETPENTFIKTPDEKKSTTREYVNGLDKKTIETPNADRLRYYDLPKIWKSHKYYCCEGPDDEHTTKGKRFEDLAGKVCTLDKPLTFSLDDMVLTDEKLKPLPSDKDTGWVPKNRAAIFSHLFNKKQYDDSAYFDNSSAGSKPPFKPAQVFNNEGVYDPDDKEKFSFFTKKPAGIEKDRNYISDYAKWTRLVIANGNMFDVFDKRVEDESSEVVGVRAAVLWNKSVDTTNRIPGDQISPRPAIDKDTTHPFFALQPFYEQHYNRMYWPNNELGRFDMAMLRCCDYIGDKEVVVTMQFFRYFFTFVSPPILHSLRFKNKYDADYADKVDFKNKIINNVNARWNGNDNINSKRAQLIPQDTAKKVIVPIVWFAQALDDKKFCHYDVTVSRVKGGRDNRGGNGTGETQIKNYEPSTNGGNDWFTSGHECGHAAALPDEYNERWNGASYGQLSFLQNTPGDPFEPDGRDMANVNSQNNTNAEGGMMNSNSEPRNRYFWTVAEWARNVTDIPFKVKFGDYDDFWVPPHDNPKKSFVWDPAKTVQLVESDWPDDFLADGTKLDKPTSNGISMHLYALGKDKFSQKNLPGSSGSPFDGILVINLMLKCNLRVSNDDGIRTNVLVAFAQAMSEFNYKYYLTGKITGTTPYAWEWEFKRCLVHFNPRYLVPDSPFTGDANSPYNPSMIESNFPYNYIINVPGTNANVPDTVAEWCDWAGGSNARPKDIDILDRVNYTIDPADEAYADSIDDAIADFEAIDPVDLIKRCDKLDEIISLCQGWSWAETDRVKDEAKDMRDYHINLGKTNEVNFQIGNNDTANYQDHYKESFKQFFPAMLGIRKIPNQLTEADFSSMVTKLAINGNIAKI